MPESAVLGAVRAAAARAPEKAAIIAANQVVTYSQLERQTAAAARIIGGGAGGDVVGLLLPNGPAFAWSLLGALWAGKTVAVLPTIAPPPLLAVMSAEAGLRTVITSGELAPRLAQARVAPLLIEQIAAGGIEPPLQNRPNPAAVLLYTSGTTGRPKAVALSDENLLANIHGARQGAGFGDEVVLGVLPLFHAYGLNITLLLQLTSAGTTVLHERFAPRAVLGSIQEHRITAVIAVPGQYRLLAKEPAQADLSFLRFCIAGAERLPEAVAREFLDRFGRQIIQGYGATEASPVISLNAPHAFRPGTVGRPLANLRVTLREDDRELPPGETGEICVEGPSIMLGYHNRPEATAAKLVNGALRTGDRGFIDADGYLHLAGRADDLIKISGEKIYPTEVERAMERIEGVEEVAVIGVPDEKHGWSLAAFVAPRSGVSLTEAGLRAACRDHLEAVKVPRIIEIVEMLPRTPAGKLDKHAMAARC